MLRGEIQLPFFLEGHYAWRPLWCCIVDLQKYTFGFRYMCANAHMHWHTYLHIPLPQRPPPHLSQKFLLGGGWP